MQNKECLWARVLRSKYKVGTVHDGNWITPKSNWSSSWRSIATGLREVVFKGLGSVPGDGILIRFWEDMWLLSTPLLDWVLGSIPETERGKRVAEYWTEGFGWRMEVISQFLPENIIQRLYAMVIGGSDGVTDHISWTGTEWEFFCFVCLLFIGWRRRVRSVYGALF